MSLVLKDPIITGVITDIDGQELLAFTTSASSVNFVRISTGTTGVAAQIYADGDDTDVDLYFNAKGAGDIGFQSPVEAIAGMVVQEGLSVPTGNLTFANVGAGGDAPIADGDYVVGVSTITTRNGVITAISP